MTFSSPDGGYRQELEVTLGDKKEPQAKEPIEMINQGNCPSQFRMLILMLIKTRINHLFWIIWEFTVQTGRRRQRGLVSSVPPCSMLTPSLFLLPEVAVGGCRRAPEFFGNPAPRKLVVKADIIFLTNFRRLPRRRQGIRVTTAPNADELMELLYESSMYEICSSIHHIVSFIR